MDVRYVLAACLLGLVWGQPEPEDKCGGLECPRYSVEQTGEGFEVRQYEPAKWAAVNVTFGRSGRRMHRCMHAISNYLNGGNAQGVTMERTMPMLKKLEGDMAGADFQKTMMMMLPMDQQANPPTPTDPELTIIEMPAMTVYAAEMQPGSGRGCGMGCSRHGSRMRSQHGRQRGHRRGGRGPRRGRGGGHHSGRDWGDGQNRDSERGQGRRRGRGPGRRFGARQGRGWERGWRQNRKDSSEDLDVAISRLRRGVAGNGESRSTRWQQFMQTQVDALRQSLGDRTVRENVMYVAMYGRPHSRNSVKELWLVAA